MHSPSPVSTPEMTIDQLDGLVVAYLAFGAAAICLAIVVAVGAMLVAAHVRRPKSDDAMDHPWGDI